MFGRKVKIGVAFGGGGARGFTHLGVIKAFEEFGLKFDFIAGTSAGSLVGAFYANGYDFKQMYEIVKNLREKITSELDSIRGVGEKRRNELITHFKTVENIKKASFEELMNVKGMDKKTAENIIKYFKKED